MKTKHAVPVILSILAITLVSGCGPGLTVAPNGGEYGSLYYAQGKRRPWPHKGIDYVKPRGTPVIAAAPGDVITSWNAVAILHTGDTEGMMTRYDHLTEVHVKNGDVAEQGQVIGTVGDTGCLHGCIPHLHFEVWIGAQHVNPTSKIGGCYEKGWTPTDPKKPLTYPLQC